jgi:hypothetical protein
MSKKVEMADGAADNLEIDLDDAFELFEAEQQLRPRRHGECPPPERESGERARRAVHRQLVSFAVHLPFSFTLTAPCGASM